ncbi:cation/H(+) antiporter 12-like [Hibiscus syriacus]|uniref:cation/H(+) antiporter 12-like n=1 Tax=Hibiscus syriacus TaxID=106335 RepID=UPI0019219BBC|nr:cation/H(+) antiporter 12-like [Hibiscus syriacus]
MAEPVAPPHPLPHGNKTHEICLTFPLKVNSYGVWENLASPSEVFTYSLPLLEIQILLIFAVTHLIFVILKPLGVTFFASQMFAGMILGPAIMNRVGGFLGKVFTEEVGIKMLDNVAIFGLAIFLFLMGVKMDVKMVYRVPGETAKLRLERFLAITVESLTAFSVVACLLSELKIVNSELGRLALSSTAISDLCSLIVVYFITLAKKWAVSRLVAIWLAGLKVLDVSFRVWRSALVDKFECLVNGFFLVVYVTTSTMRVDLTEVFNKSPVGFSIIFPILAFLAKFISCFVASFWNMMTWRDSLALALIMSSKGVVELSYFSSFRDSKMISEKTFSKLSLFVLANATVIPILVKYLYDPVSKKYAAYQKSSLVHLKPNAELPILACIHRPEHVQPLIDVLEITCPTKQSPNFVYALHLIQLAGRDSPVFIAHHENGAVGSFEHIVAFNHYEQNNWGLVKVNAYTAISPPKLMHEDICNLVLDKQISFILLPFHIKWCIEGSVEAENSVIRNLNRNVLDRAPCSIGILVDRRRKPSLSRSSFYSICMLFMGGKDDREGLTLAKRMARDPRVKLTVIHLFSEKDRGNIDWDTMLDAEILKGIKNNEFSNITYIGEVSNNGPQTATIVRSVVDDFDLMIIGRHYGVDSVQTKGLTEWSEFPELGIMGDILSSPDLDSRVSVLVVQQHHHVIVGRH